MNKTNWWDRLKEMWILWQHDGDYNKPHALWTSWLHSDTFNNWTKLVENPKLLAEVVSWIIENIKPELSEKKPDWVLWPAFWAITIWHELAKQIDSKFAFTEPIQTENWKMQVLKRFDIKPGDSVLVVEDALSTWWSIEKSIAVLEEIKAEVLDYVASIVNWSGKDEINWRKIYSLYSYIPKKWEEKDCELCKKWSTPLRPKANWDKFSL